MTPLQVGDLVKISLQIATQYPALQRRPFWSREKIEKYQLKLLRQRLSEAREHVPMYVERGLPRADEITSLSDWTRLPLITKKDLLSGDRAHRLHPEFNVEDLIESKSSGSTGQALDVYYDRESFYVFVLAGLRLYTMAFSYRPWHRQTYVYTSPYPFDSLFGMYPMEFISTLTPIPEILAKLRANPPDLLVCYPSHLRAIVDQMKPEDFERIRPQVINVNSEMSSTAERQQLGKQLGAFVFDDYSSEELTRIASQCRHLSYHLFDDINYMEVVDDAGAPVPEGVVGNLVGSNLHNRAMPLLRYMQGDRGAIRSRPCECGRNFRILEKLEGRKNDAFLLPGGERVSSGFLLDLTYGVFLNYDQAVRAFCLVQDRADEWVLEVVPGARWSADLEQRLAGDLMRDLKQPSVRIVVKIVEQVTRTASGKSNPIISRVKK